MPVVMEGRITDGSQQSVRVLAHPPLNVSISREGYYDLHFSADGYSPSQISGFYVGSSGCETAVNREVTVWLVPGLGLS